MTETAEEVTYQITHDVDAIDKNALNFRVTDKDSYEDAGLLLVRIKGLRKEVADTFDPIVKKAHNTHKEALAQKKRHDDPLNKAEKHYKNEIGTFKEKAEQERRAREAELLAAAQKEDEERRLKEAADLEAAGQQDAAEAVLNEPSVVSVQTETGDDLKLDGISTRDKWSAEVVNFDELVKAVALGKAPLNVIQADMTVLNGLARQLKDSLQYPGVRVVKETVVAAGS